LGKSGRPPGPPEKDVKGRGGRATRRRGKDIPTIGKGDMDTSPLIGEDPEQGGGV